MRYKVGDKVRVRSDLKAGKYYGFLTFVDEMKQFEGKVLTIYKVLDYSYILEGNCFRWTDEMLEQVKDKISAEEAIKLFAAMCDEHDTCYDCPLTGVSKGVRCKKFMMSNPDNVLKVIKDYKSKNEKSIETEWSWWVEIVNTKGHILAHEEKLNTDKDIDTQAEEIFKKYVSEHEGNFYLIREYRCTAKEDNNEN